MLKIAHPIAAIALVWSGSAASSAMAQAPTAQPAKKVHYLNERVCENITLTGSRLATKRYCGTRAEWEERKRLDREVIDAAQRSPCVIQSTSARGTASC